MSGGMHEVWPIEAHKEAIRLLNERAKRTEETIEDMKLKASIRFTKMDAKIEEFEKRIEKEEEHTQVLLEIVHSVKGMTTTLEKVVDKQGAQDILLNQIITKPGQLAIKTWIFVATMVGTAIIMGLIGSVSGWLKF